MIEQINVFLVDISQQRNQLFETGNASVIELIDRYYRIVQRTSQGTLNLEVFPRNLDEKDSKADYYHELLGTWRELQQRQVWQNLSLIFLERKQRSDQLTSDWQSSSRHTVLATPKMNMHWGNWSAAYSYSCCGIILKER